MWFLKSMQKISHYSELLILSALVHFCISFPIWVLSHGKLECLLHMVAPALWSHCPELPWWTPLIEEVSYLRTVNCQCPRRVFSLRRHPSLSCYHQCTFWSHQRFFHWNNPCTAVYCHPCKPTWSAMPSAWRYCQVKSTIQSNNKKCNLVWCIQPIECVQNTLFF